MSGVEEIDPKPMGGLSMSVRHLLVTGMSILSAAASTGPSAQQTSPNRAQGLAPLNAKDVWEPVLLGPRRGGVLLLPDGTLKTFVSVQVEGNTYQNYSMTSADAVYALRIRPDGHILLTPLPGRAIAGTSVLLPNSVPAAPG